MQRPIEDLVNLLDRDASAPLGADAEAVRRAMLDGDLDALRAVGGSFAEVARDGETVLLARSLDRPLRYFLAKQASGPLLLVADRIDAIAGWLEAHEYDEQFRPEYTRMAPAHHITRLRLLGCPDPNPTYTRFLDPPMATLPADLDVIGRHYVEALASVVADWLRAQPADEPIGVLFSGGADSGAVLVALHDTLLRLGQSPARLKAFTLAVDGAGSDVEQARSFLRRLDLEFLGEEIAIDAAELDPLDAVRRIEDYKARDVECATVQLALLRALRERYPDWRLLVDGDGGDENLKDYPIEENPELTIRSVVGNSMLYQEGWGVDSIKHSLTYSGGYSRGCVRTFAPLRQFDFIGFSPFTQPAVVTAAEAIPFDELTAGSVDALYRLKGEVLQRGVEAVFGRRIPVFEKRRFQEGAVPEGAFAALFGGGEAAYRAHFGTLYGAG